MIVFNFVCICNKISGSMMIVFIRLLHTCFVFLLITQHLGTAFILQMTPERQRCPEVAFIEGSNEYRSNLDLLTYLAFKSVVLNLSVINAPG